MSRIHLFEFEDQPLFPKFIRDYGTDFLQFIANKTFMFKPVLPLLERGIRSSKAHTIIDLASGGGGGLVKLNEELLKIFPDLKIILTDYYPNLEAFVFIKSQASNIDFETQPVNALDVPKELKGLRTQFLSFHHFRPEEALRILQNSVDANSSIAIFEAQERNLPSLLAMFFSPLTVLLTTPFIRPFRFGRLVFTYLIPIVPLFVWWDGIVSLLRTYSVKEMKELVSQLNQADSYTWDIGRMKSGPGAILYLLGERNNRG
ncbi:MAG: hypothetical protein IPJ20_09695 [Flammeovirgaceae bacterium]|nr:hypothetical protein [Flammeovirgaceae bacterium]